LIDSDLDNHAQPTLDIIIPCFNPSLEWEKQLTHYIQELSNHLQEISIQFILVNDGSNNNRFTEIETNYLKTEFPPIKIVANPVNLGKGAALRLGVSHAKSEFQIFTDIDYSTKSTMRIIYELLLETFILFILVISSKCLSNYIISLFTKSVINHNISFSLLVSIIYSSLNKSYINKIKEIRHRINK
jgi:GT2 family glycosyltransferase